MSRRPRASVPPASVPLPRRPEVSLSFEQLATACGLSVVRLDRLVRVGLVEPEPPGSGVFPATTAVRLKRMLRLRADLGVNLAGAQIIVDLLTRLDDLEAELTRLRRSGRSVTSANKEMR
jgi:DNA-binding transcriptional MerR regulator